MFDLAAYGRVQFIDSLIGYLEVRAWAFEKISTSPIGSKLIDLMNASFSLFHKPLFSY